MEKRKRRKYGDEIGGRYKRVQLRKGLKVVHIFGEAWCIGRSGFTNHEDWGQNVLHQVIYGPDGKEYHLWGDEKIEALQSDDGYVDRHGNKTDETKVKIFILTSILDKRSLWEFDLEKKPNIGKKIRVLYNNGTIKNIVFSGIWEDITIKKYYNKLKQSGYDRTVTPIAYRLIDQTSDLSKTW
jgi:hypothetical protein